MKIAVTGGAGQLGTLLVERLLLHPDVEEVCAIDLDEPPTVGTRLRHCPVDVRSPELHEQLEGVDAVVHLAFLVTQKANTETFRGVNVDGSRNVFEACVRAGVRHVVYSSSIAAYGVVHGHPVPITEDTPRQRQPELPYAAAKYDVEAYLDGFEPEHPETIVTRIRPAILIGKYMPHALGRLMARGYIRDTGEIPIPIVWDADVAAAIVLALDKGPESHGPFNLGAGELLPPRELAEAGGLRLVNVPTWALELLSKLSVPMHAVRQSKAADPSWLRVTDVRMIMSAERAREVLGWNPSCPTARDVIQAYARTRTGEPHARIKWFVRLANLSRYARNPLRRRRETQRISLDVHLQIEGPSGGDIALRVQNTLIRAAFGRPRGPDAVLTLSCDTFLAFLSGQQDVMSAQMLGRLRVRGEPASIMILASLIGNLRRLAERRGIIGWAARRVTASGKARV